MGIRGRQSRADLAVVTSIETVRRPPPPSELTDEQASEWQAVVDRLPADWFARETLPMLAQYCRHVASARRVAQLLASSELSDDFSVADYDRLLKMQERESRCLASLATKMRISQQSTYDPKKKKPSLAQKPWEIL